MEIRAVFTEITSCIVFSAMSHQLSTPFRVCEIAALTTDTVLADIVPVMGAHLECFDVIYRFRSFA